MGEFRPGEGFPNIFRHGPPMDASDISCVWKIGRVVFHTLTADTKLGFPCRSSFRQRHPLGLVRHLAQSLPSARGQ